MKIIEIDGINPNPVHFLGMTKEEAVKEMIADGIPPGKTEKDKATWAGKAYDAMKEANTPKVEKPAEATDKK